jgi:hypothetical protein
LIAVIAPVTEVEGEGKRKGMGEDRMTVPFRWNRGAREANSGAGALGRKNGSSARLETSWGGGPKGFMTGMKLGRGERKEKGK